METDPVCGMAVDETRAAGSALHAGRTYYFCTPACQAKFQVHPEQYVAVSAVQKCRVGLPKGTRALFA